jgi:protein-tyrosine phosphatase
VDLHFHLLPGVDDGPEEMTDSVALAEAAVRDGTGIVVATPHVRGDYVTDVASLPELVAEVRDELRREGIALEIRCGGELGHDMVGRLRQHELELIAQGPAGARWLLVEAPFTAMTDAFQHALDELEDRGFGVLIGHPERSADATLLARAAPGQVNALSLTGGHGDEALQSARRMLAEVSVYVVGSDAHGPTRPPALTMAREALAARGVDSARARALTSTVPWRLLTHGLPARPVEARAAGIPA